MAHTLIQRTMTAASGAGLAALILACAVSAARAEDAPPSSPEAGLKLAQTLCQNCHLLPGTAPGNTVTVGIPSLLGIANKPGQTGPAIERVLIQPHAPMPDMKLSNQEIQDLIAYFDSLRTDPSLPPLQPSTKPAEKPKHPTPS